MDPVVGGAADLTYVRDALARAGQTIDVVDVVAEPLTGGRTASQVTRLTVRARGGDARSLVLKAVPPAVWRRHLGMDETEARLWLSGTTRTLPDGIRSPTVDVARHESRGEWWLLMEDVSAGIQPRGAYDDAKARTFMRAIARMHARHWESDVLPVPAFEGSANALSALCAHVARPSALAEPWLASFDESFWVPRAMMPAFLDALSPSDADFYVSLCRDHARIARALAAYPRTLCHGDLRRANVSFVGDDVVLFDWEFASRGPAARDLQWYWFLQFWAYPAAGATPGEDRPELLDVYLEALGPKIDRARFDESCELGWLSVFCQIGCLLSDGPAAKEIVPSAIARARAIHARYMR